MNHLEIEEWYTGINKLLANRRLFEAFDRFSVAFAGKSYNMFTTPLDELRFTYSNMLNYLVKGIQDPLQHEIYNNLLLKTYDLADQIRLELLNQPGFRIASIKNDLEKQIRINNEDLTENLLGLSFDYELNEMLRSTAMYEDESESESAVKHRKAIQRAFNFLWLTNRFSEDDVRVIEQIFNSNSFPWYEKSMLVSAITLGLVRTFDTRRLELLTSLYSHKDPQVSVRALIGVLISISLYDHRIVLSPNLSVKLQLLKDDPAFESDAFAIVAQIFRAKDTDRITRKFRDEIIPDIIRFNEDLSKRLNLEKLLAEEDDSDKNPDWEKYFDDQPGLAKKLEDLTNMQMEGNDVFLGAFSLLKNFGFFRDLHHWFLPFYKEHYTVVAALRNETGDFRDIILKGVELSPYMCNSDKFSFVLNISLMPESQKELMAQMLSAEAEQIEELLSEELSDPELNKKRIIIQYIQDLYRFFKLNPIKGETGDLFELPMDIHNTKTLRALIPASGFYKNVAGFMFDQERYSDALQAYQMLGELGENTAELYEKSGYCLQKTGKYDRAIEMYKKADLFDTNRKWLLGKLAQCYLKAEKPSEALNVYLELASMDPDNMKIQAAVGTCYLNTGDAANALEYFYRIEFNDPGSAHSIRPVAWCLFILGRIGEAETYYRQLLGMEPNAYDYMNAGHVALCRNDFSEASRLYAESIRLRGTDQQSFFRAYREDRRYLIKNGVDPDSLALLLDYVRTLN